MGFLTVPERGDTRVRRIVRKQLLLAVRTLLTTPVPGPVGRSVAAVRPVLQRVLADEPERLLQAVRSPEVLPWLLLAERGWDASEAFAGLLPPLLVAVGRLPEDCIWAHPLEALVYGTKLCRFQPAARGLSIGPLGIEVTLHDGARVPLADVAGEPAAVPIRAGLVLALSDRFPLRMLEAHPEKQGNAVDLAGRDPEVWVAALQQALALVDRALPTWAEQLPQVLARIVPVGFHAERHFSASYREAPGTIYCSLHPDPMTLAEAIVHEVQHGILNRLLWLDPVLHNGRTFWTESPVRPDLRPLEGVLLAAHAFVPVAALHRALSPDDVPDPARLAQRRAEVLAGNTRALQVLDAAQPSALGQRVLTDLHALHAELLQAAPALPAVSPDRMPPG